MICPSCKGEKEIKIFPKLTRSGKVICTLPCDRCDQKGDIPDIQETWIRIGSTIREDRIKRRKTLQAEAEMLGVDILVLSHAERGMIDPVKLSAKKEE